MKEISLRNQADESLRIRFSGFARIRRLQRFGHWEL